MSHARPLALLCLAAPLLAAAPAHASDPVNNVSPHRLTYTVPGDTLKVPYYHNHPLYGVNLTSSTFVVFMKGSILQFF
jgi:hypothetical protein